MGKKGVDLDGNFLLTTLWWEEGFVCNRPFNKPDNAGFAEVMSAGNFDDFSHSELFQANCAIQYVGIRDFTCRRGNGVGKLIAIVRLVRLVRLIIGKHLIMHLLVGIRCLIGISMTLVGLVIVIVVVNVFISRYFSLVVVVVVCRVASGGSLLLSGNSLRVAGASG
jgi:hypothetical protein